MTQRVLTVDDAAVKAMLQGTSLAAFNPAPAWLESAAYMRARTDQTFKKLRRGGTYRGVTWREFAPQYRRHNPTPDGPIEEVPAWGGVPRVARGWSKAKDTRPGRAGKVSTGKRMKRITGKVSGRLRPSGTRVTKNSSLVQDTGTLRSRAAMVVLLQKDRLVLGPQGVRYAARQNSMRPFLFFQQPEDGVAIGKIFAQHIQRGARAGKLGPGAAAPPAWEQYG